MKPEYRSHKFIDHLLAYILFTFLVAGCAISDNEIDPQDGFIRIYNDERFEQTFKPIDMIQMADSGFLVLGTYDLNKTYLLRTDKHGFYQWDLQMEPPFVNPIPGLFSSDSATFFFCMDELTLATYLMQVDDNTKSASISNTYPDIIYPLHASKKPGDGYLLLSYDRDALASRLTELSNTFQQGENNTYAVIEDVEEDIIAHVSGIGERLPFFTGTSNGKYFFNGYSNYSFSLHFVSQADLSQTGVINGFRDSGIISAAINIAGSDYALTRYSFGENYILSKASLEENSVSFSSNLEGNPHPEIEQSAYTKLKKIIVDDTPAIALATTTKSGQIILYLYNESSGDLMGSKTFGFTNPYSAVELVQTLDEGLAILGNTFVTGRFSRIALFKISESDLKEFVNQ